MKAPTAASLHRRLPALADALKRNADKSARQIAIIELINEYTGSSFTGLNLNDPLGRFLGCVLWPMPPERLKIVAEFGPSLSAMLLAGPLQQLVWDFGTERAFALPDALLHGTAVYKHVYRHAGINHVAWYDYPPGPDQTHVVAMISRSDRAFSSREVQALHIVCDRFRKDLTQVEPGGQFAPFVSNVSDHSLDLDAEFRPRNISTYAHALIALFYGPLREHGTSLPAALIEDITLAESQYATSVLPMGKGAYYAFTKRSQGRLLCCIVNSTDGAARRLTLYEDLKHLERLKRIKVACRDLKRDRYMVLAVCLALLDGVNSEGEIRKLAGLVPHKSSSARRIISCARRVLERY